MKTKQRDSVSHTLCCPHCRHGIDLLVPTGGAQPQAQSGSVAICTHCGELGIVELEQGPMLRKATGGELAALREDHAEVWRRLMAIAGRIKGVKSARKIE